MRGRPVTSGFFDISNLMRFHIAELRAAEVKSALAAELKPVTVAHRTSEWESEKPDILTMIERMQELVLKQRDHLGLGTGTISQEEYDRRLAMVRAETSKQVAKLRPYQQDLIHSLRFRTKRR